MTAWSRFAWREKPFVAGLADCRTWNALDRLVQRAVITVDPDGAQRRREKSQREHARLRLWREAWGTCAMQATGLPPDEALAANARVEARAREDYIRLRSGFPEDAVGDSE